MGEYEIAGIVRDVFSVESALEEGMDYIESGLLDSLAFINLLAAFEERGIEIQPTEIRYEDFRNVDEIKKTVRRFS